LNWLVLAAGLGLGYFLQQAVVHAVRQTQQQSFDANTQEIVLLIEQRLKAYEQVLDGKITEAESMEES